MQHTNIRINENYLSITANTSNKILINLYRQKTLEISSDFPLSLPCTQNYHELTRLITFLLCDNKKKLVSS